MGILENIFNKLSENGGDIEKLGKEEKEIILRYSVLHMSIDRLVKNSDGDLYKIYTIDKYKDEYLVVYGNEERPRERYIKSVEEFICSKKNGSDEFDMQFLKPQR